MKYLALKISFLFPLYAIANSFQISKEVSLKNTFHTFIEKIEDDLSDWLFIYPGTKWCGVGDVADNDTDYGKEIETDKCCQTHDKCPGIISGYETKHNLTNPSFYTRLHCNCDTTFYKCLKSVGTPSSIQVGSIYFNLLNAKCFREDNNGTQEGINKIDNTPQKLKKYKWAKLPKF